MSPQFRQFLEDVFGKMLFDLAMAGHGLASMCFGVAVPVMATTVADEDASHLLDLPDQIASLHAS